MFVDGPPKLPEEAVNVAINVQSSDGLFQEVVIDALRHEIVACFLVRVLSQCCAQTTFPTHTHEAPIRFASPIAISNSTYFLNTAYHRSSHGLQPDGISIQIKIRELRVVVLVYRRPRYDHDVLFEFRFPNSSNCVPASQHLHHNLTSTVFKNHYIHFIL